MHPAGIGKVGGYDAAEKVHKIKKAHQIDGFF
jgi:hypothetical protein